MTGSNDSNKSTPYIQVASPHYLVLIITLTHSFTQLLTHSLTQSQLALPPNASAVTGDVGNVFIHVQLYHYEGSAADKLIAQGLLEVCLSEWVSEWVYMRINEIEWPYVSLRSETVRDRLFVWGFDECEQITVDVHVIRFQVPPPTKIKAAYCFIWIVRLFVQNKRNTVMITNHPHVRCLSFSSCLCSRFFHIQSHPIGRLSSYTV